MQCIPGMAQHGHRRLEAGDRFPPLALPALPDGRERALRTLSRDALVLLLLPGLHDEWISELDAIAAASAEIEEWYARIVVVVAGDLEAAARVSGRWPGSMTVLADAGEDAFRMVGISSAQAGLVIADRYGQIYFVQTVSQGQALPGPAEVEQWVTFLATQCPECGVIDEPGYGEWAP